MTRTVVVLTEGALRPSDAAHIAALLTPDDAQVEVLVPADTEHHLVAEIIDHLGLLNLRAIWNEVVGKHPSPEQARFDAAAAVTRSVNELRGAGLEAHGRVVADDPMPDLDKTITATGAIVAVP